VIHIWLLVSDSFFSNLLYSATKYTKKALTFSVCNDFEIDQTMHFSLIRNQT